jgi:hypothetical protein
LEAAHPDSPQGPSEPLAPAEPVLKSPIRTSACFTRCATSWNCWRPWSSTRLPIKKYPCIW